MKQSKPKCRTLTTYAAIQALHPQYYYSSQERKKLHLNSHFLCAVPGKPTQLDVFIAQGDLRHDAITTWRDKQALADTIFICAVSLHCTFLMVFIFKRGCSTLRCFPNSVIGSKGFCLLPHSGIQALETDREPWQPANILKCGTFPTKTQSLSLSFGGIIFFFYLKWLSFYKICGF